ncbi:MAG TPA: RDD family protein [Thermoanaerobaculia bacterium]|nr:RDD family protein [Thermoanaerobaculia bacterium]
MPRFDEIELHAVPLGGVPGDALRSEAGEDAPDVETTATLPASRFKRLLALLTDLSLFLALALALSPLLPDRHDLITAWRDDWPAILGLSGFLLVFSYYYFVGSWLLWGKTVGGAIFDVRIISTSASTMAFAAATRRWAAVLLSLLTCGIGFFLAALPSRRSLADRLSGTRCVAG